ncbi:MAG TPA: serine hydrolase, partial [Candidatus Acidoferrales bacterium]|nr:serine hydrolase [Candidatus Acidoferrales bacterium]
APQEAGFDPAMLCTALDQAQAANIHSVIVERHGRLVAEIYRRGPDRSIWSLFTHDVEFGPKVQHDLRSISKSVVGLLFGVVNADGRIGELSTPVLNLIPKANDLHSPERDQITIEHLLTMSSGLKWEEALATYGSLANDETHLFWAWSHDRYALNRAVVATPGTKFNYNGGTVTVLSNIVSRSAQMSLRDLARTKLFEPLGISDWKWIGDVYGRPLAFAGLRMRPRDLVKLGRLLLDHGQWRGNQIVPAKWVDESLRPHIPIPNGLQYGYLWWTGTVDHGGRKLGWAAGFGNGGQRLFVVPELDMAVVVTAGAYNQAGILDVLQGLFAGIVAAAHD